MALINEAECKLLKNKINYCIDNEIKICISIESAFMNLLHTVFVEDCKINDEFLYILAGDFDFTIYFNKGTEVTYNEDQNSFKFNYEDSEIEMFILE